MAISVASTSFAQLAYIPETESGTTPTTGKGINLRMTGESLERTISKDVSKEIESSRQTSSMYLTDAQVSGGINIELSAREYDPFIEAALMDTWSTFGINGVMDGGEVTITGAADDSTLAFTGAVDFSALSAGNYITVSADGLESGTKRPLRIKSVTGSTITVESVLVSQIGLTSSKIFHGRLTNGVTKRSFSIEKLLTDKNQTFLFKGMQASKMTLNFESRNVISGNIDFIGTTQEVGEGPVLGDKTSYTSSQTGAVINSVVGMKGMLINGKDVRDELTAGIQKISLEYDNAMKGHDAIGVLGNVDVTAGTIAASGSATIYLNKASIYNEVLNQTRNRLEWAVFDNEGHGYAFILPSVEWGDPKSPVSGKDEAVMLELSYTALKDPIAQKTIFIERF